MVSRKGELGVLAAALGVAAVLAATSPASAGGGGNKISDRDIERAREACGDIAHNRNWKVTGTHFEGKNDDRGIVNIRITGDRRGQGERERDCRYNVRTRDAEFDDQD